MAGLLSAASSFKTLKRRKALVHAVQEGRIHDALSLIDYGADVDEPDVQGALGSPIIYLNPNTWRLHRALACRGSITPTRPRRQGGTLHSQLLITAQVVPVIHTLLEHRANPDYQNEEGSTPLRVAAYMGSVPLIQAMVNVKANVNLFKPATGTTPLFVAWSV